MFSSDEKMEESYQNLSRVFRSNLFPSVEREWKSSTKTTFDDYSTVNQQTEVNKQHFRRKDWLGKWHERDSHRLNIIKMGMGSDGKYASRMKKQVGMFYLRLKYKLCFLLNLIMSISVNHRA